MLIIILKKSEKSGKKQEFSPWDSLRRRQMADGQIVDSILYVVCGISYVEWRMENFAFLTFTLFLMKLCGLVALWL